MTRYHVGGELVPSGAATVSVADAGLQGGHAAAATMRAYGGSVFELDAHLDRVERTCGTLSIDVPDREDLRGRIRETLVANDLDDAAVRLLVTVGDAGGSWGEDGVARSPPEEATPTVVVAVESLPRGGRKGSRTWSDPAVVATAKVRTPPAAAVPPGLSTPARPAALLARLEATGDVDEMLLRDLEGHLAAGTTADVCFVDDEGVHVVDSRSVAVAPGVTRSAVVGYAREADVPVRAGRYTPEDLRSAEEAFLTSTRWEVRPVATVDGIEVGGGPVTDLLTTTFRNRIEAAHY